MSSSSTGRRKILVLIPNWLGDLILSLPALRALRAEGSLVAVGSAAFLDILEDSSCVDGCIPYDRKGGDASIPAFWRMGRRCSQENADLCLAFPPSLRAAVLARLTAAPRRRGVGGEGRSLFLNETAREWGKLRDRHLADQWMAMARGSTVIEGGSAIPELKAGHRSLHAFSRLQDEMKSPLPRKNYFVLAPGATYGPTKMWPAERYMELAGILSKDTGLACVIVGGTDPEEIFLCEQIAKKTGSISTAGKTDLACLTGLLEEAVLFVGNDSGPMHLAAALGTATLGIFMSTSPVWTSPRGRRAGWIVTDTADCAPCFLKSCPRQMQCLQGLPSEKVAAAALEILKESHE